MDRKNIPSVPQHPHVELAVHADAAQRRRDPARLKQLQGVNLRARPGHFSEKGHGEDMPTAHLVLKKSSCAVPQNDEFKALEDTLV